MNKPSGTMQHGLRQRVEQGLGRRYRRERRFRLYGVLSLAFAMGALCFLFYDVISRGSGAFTKFEMRLELQYDAEEMGIFDPEDIEELEFADFQLPLDNALNRIFPEVQSFEEQGLLYSLLSGDAEFEVQRRIMQNPAQLLGSSEELWVTASRALKHYLKGEPPARAGPEWRRKKEWVQALSDRGLLRRSFNNTFFSAADSRDAESAGIRGALVGSLLTLVVCFLFSFPVGVAAAVYLEEFAPRNRWVDMLEVNINNLAAVPSVIFGLLGMVVFLNVLHIPRSAPLVGGLVLALMTLPTIIISSRVAIQSIPGSIREAALGLGASHMQLVFGHGIPLAMPSMLTGSIIGMARALGESAPLLMIGMVAFIVDVPSGFFDPATVLPVQIYLWADSPERAFVELTAGAIMVLLGFLITMNGLAAFLRHRLERDYQ